MSVITLTTDFGTRDWFVGAMKGVILNINPRARLVDVTHEIPPGDIAAGAFALAAAVDAFPRGTIHVVVVDPGVGGPRPAIAARTDRFLFVGPDNGVVSLALRKALVRGVRRLENRRFFRIPVSRTFHGRDVFAPVAAHLSKGTPFNKLGERVSTFEQLPWPEPSMTTDGVRGQVSYIDRFGNAITNIPSSLVPDGARLFARIPGRRRVPLQPSYGAVPPGQPVAVLGSAGFLEIAVNQGSAAKALKLSTAAKVSLVFERASGASSSTRQAPGQGHAVL